VKTAENLLPFFAALLIVLLCPFRHKTNHLLNPKARMEVHDLGLTERLPPAASAADIRAASAIVKRISRCEQTFLSQRGTPLA
jgi:hypothetical protein